MNCQSKCHYQKGWNCFIQCCDRCTQLYSIQEMNDKSIEVIKFLIWATEDVYNNDVPALRNRKEEIKNEIERLKGLLLELYA